MLAKNFEKFTIGALQENIKAVELCIGFDKSTDNESDFMFKDGCLGIPAFILLSSIIDAIGSNFKDSSIIIEGKPKIIKNNGGHFFILNHEKLFNLGLSNKIIEAFYKQYRSPLTHNNTLTPNTIIDLGNENSLIFETNNANELTRVNLIPLLRVVKEAVKKFIEMPREELDVKGKLKKELDCKGNKSKTIFPSDKMPNLSAVTETIISKFSLE